MDQDGTWRGGRSQPRRLFCWMETQPPPQKGGGAPQFSAHVYYGQTAAWFKMPLGTEVGLDVRWGPSSPPQKGGGGPSPFFGPCLSHVSPAKTAEPIEMPFGLRTLVGPGNHALDQGPDPAWEWVIFEEGEWVTHCKV